MVFSENKDLKAGLSGKGFYKQSVKRFAVSIGHKKAPAKGQIWLFRGECEVIAWMRTTQQRNQQHHRCQ